MSASDAPGLFADRELAQALERAEGCANASYVEARAALAPHSNAGWIDVAGTYAMFESPDSPVTQTFGLGMFGEVKAADLDRIEAYFRERGAPVSHEISPLCDKSVWPLVSERGYTPIEFTSLLFMDLKTLPSGATLTADDVHVRVARPSESELFASLSASAWSADSPELAPLLTQFMETVFHTRGAVPFIAEKHGQPIATGSLNIQDRVALLAGASTIPEGRRQGAQRALLAARLRHAAEAGCQIAAMGAEPGSTSQRNAERSGFRIAYTRSKWRLSTVAV